MRKEIFLGEFKDITINNKLYTLSFRDVTTKDFHKFMSNSKKLECMVYESDNNMTPFKRFNLVYNYKNRDFWAWTMNIINAEKLEVIQAIESLLNEKEISLTA